MNFLRKTNNTLIFDISAGSVGASYRKEMDLLWATRELITVSANLDPMIMEKKMLKATEECSNKFMKWKEAENGVCAVERVDCFLSSPWIHSETKIISKQFATSTKITKNIITELIDQYANESERNLMEHPEALSMVEKNIIDIKLNGYSCKEPLGKLANSVELTVLLAFTPKKLVDVLKNTIEKSKLA